MGARSPHDVISCYLLLGQAAPAREEQSVNLGRLDDTVDTYAFIGCVDMFRHRAVASSTALP